MPTLTLTGVEQTLNYELTAGAVAPLDAYEQWAAEIGVSPTATLQSFERDDGAIAVTLDAPLFDGWSTTAMLSSEAGIGLYTVDPTNPTAITYSLPNISRFFGLTSRPKLLFTFHPQSDLQVYQTRLQRANGATILFWRFSQWDNQEIYRYDAAIRINQSSLLFVGQAYDQPANLYFNEMLETNSTSLVAQTLVGTNSAGEIVNLLANTSPVARVELPPLLSQPSALASYGATERTGTVTAPGIFDGSLLAKAQIYPITSVVLDGVLGQTESEGYINQVSRIVLPTFVGSHYSTGQVFPAAYAACPSMLTQFVMLRAAHDFTAQVKSNTSYYLAKLITPTEEVMVPISSWQATLQLNVSNYVQCVVPAVLNHVQAINSATEFVILRTAVSDEGISVTQEMARTGINEARFTRGPYRYTCTLSGYSPGFAPGSQTGAIADRTLEKVRSITSGNGGIRARCAIDWLLRPGMTARINDASITVAYINYYVGQGDAYMDVGEREV